MIKDLERTPTETKETGVHPWRKIERFRAETSFR
jgi:hypothetical protein